MRFLHITHWALLCSITMFSLSCQNKKNDKASTPDTPSQKSETDKKTTTTPTTKPSDLPAYCKSDAPPAGSKILSDNKYGEYSKRPCFDNNTCKSCWRTSTSASFCCTEAYTSGSDTGSSCQDESPPSGAKLTSENKSSEYSKRPCFDNGTCKTCWRSSLSDKFCCTAAYPSF